MQNGDVAGGVPGSQEIRPWHLKNVGLVPKQMSYLESENESEEIRPSHLKNVELVPKQMSYLEKLAHESAIVGADAHHGVQSETPTPQRSRAGSREHGQASPKPLPRSKKAALAGKLGVSPGLLGRAGLG